MEDWLLILKLSWLGTAAALVAFYGRWWIAVALAVAVTATIVALTRSEVASIIPIDKSGLGAMGISLRGGFMAMAVIVGAAVGLLLRPVRDYLSTRLNRYPPRYPRTFFLAAILSPATAISAAAVYDLHAPPSWGCARNGLPITIGDLSLSPPPLDQLALDYCRIDHQHCWTKFRIDDGSDKRKYCSIDEGFLHANNINSVYYSAYRSSDEDNIWRIRSVRFIGDVSDVDLMSFLEGRKKPHVIEYLRNPNGGKDLLVCGDYKKSATINCTLTYRLKGKAAAIAGIHVIKRVGLEASTEAIYDELNFLLGRLQVER